MQRRISALALVVVLSLVPIAGCGGDDDSNGGDSAAESGSVSGGDSGEGQAPGNGSAEAVDAAKVDIVDFAYDPVDVTVSVGGTVEWTNSDAAPHTATADDDSFDTGSLDKGDAAKVTFDQAGTFTYICTFHPFMNATVSVVE